MRALLRTSVLAAVVAAASPVAAQVFVEARIGGSLDGFDARGAEPEQRSSAAGFLGLEYRFAEERARVSYALDAVRYGTPGDWGTLLHELETVYRIDLSASEKSRLFLGASGTWRDNGEAWSAAGYRALSARANLELRPRVGTTLRLGYRIDARDFPDLPELDQLEQDGFGSALFNFQTRTTLIGEVHVGSKSYEGAPWVADSRPAIDFPAAGRGRGAGGMGPSLRPGSASSSAARERAARVAWLVRVAQSLAERTGLSLQYGGRHGFGSLPTLLVTTPALFFDDGVYDDPYASDAWSARAVLKHQLERLGTARAWGAWERRDYRSTLAYASDGEVSGALREDRLWRAGAEWRVPLLRGSSGAVALDLDVAYAFTAHRSNDAFYDYRSHAVGVSLSARY